MKQGFGRKGCRYLLDRGCRGKEEIWNNKNKFQFIVSICKVENQGHSRKPHQAEVWEIFSTSLGKEVTFLETNSRSQEWWQAVEKACYSFSVTPEEFLGMTLNVWKLREDCLAVTIITKSTDSWISPSSLLLRLIYFIIFSCSWIVFSSDLIFSVFLYFLFISQP